MSTSFKPFTIEDLSIFIKGVRIGRPSSKIVYCHGCFDLLHIGHIRHLQEAARLGTMLVVTITPDHFVGKGPDRPLVPAEERAEMVAALKCVSCVAINRWPSSIEAIKLIAPDIYAKGHEYLNNKTPALCAEEEVLQSVGGKLTFTSPSSYSTTELVRRIHAGSQL